MTTDTASTAARRKALFSRTLVLTALLVVAAAGSVFCVRSVRADAPIPPRKKDAPAPVSPEAQTIANLLVGLSMGNPALSASTNQVLWGGVRNDDPPNGETNPPPGATPPPQNPASTNQAARRPNVRRPNVRRITPFVSKTTSAKSG